MIPGLEGAGNQRLCLLSKPENRQYTDSPYPCAVPFAQLQLWSGGWGHHTPHYTLPHLYRSLISLTDSPLYLLHSRPQMPIPLCLMCIFFLCIFYCKIHIIKCAFQPFLSVWFCDIKHFTLLYNHHHLPPPELFIFSSETPHP